MDLYANQRIRIKYDSVIKIKRSLEGAGKLYVTEGEEVTPSDILGKFQLSAGYATFNLAEMLGVSKVKVREYMVKKEGERVYKGELLAQREGFFSKKSVKSPTDGIIEEYNPTSGMLRMKYLPKEVALPSGVYGIVEKVNKETGEVEIKTLATEVYGVFGSGKERQGNLHIIDGKGNLMMKHQMTKDLKGTIVVTGALIYEDTLKKGLEYSVAGIISGGLNAEDYLAIAGNIEPFKRLGSDIGTSLMVTEGFGPISIGNDIYKEITPYSEKFVFLNGNATRLLLPALNIDSIIIVRKVSFPSKKITDHQPELEIKKIAKGATIRIIWPPFVGTQGKVIGMDQTPTVLPSGISTYLLTVETSWRKIKVPYPNVELI